MAKTVAIIGAGQIGFAASQAFLSDGWDVRILARTKPAWLRSDEQFAPYVLGESAAPSADVVLDTIAFDEDDVARYDPDVVGRYIAVSSASVYCDAQGRGFETDRALGFPEFPDPISEEVNRVEPGPENYSSKKVRMENKAVEMFGDRATLIRPCAIYGPYSRHPREWWFVKRMLDGRKHIPLAFGGKSVFHTTCVEMMSWFMLTAAERDLDGAFNIADDNAPEVSLIGTMIAETLNTDSEFVPFDGAPQGTVGRTPWSLPNPFKVNCRKAYDTGWDGFTIYPGIGNAIEWLVELKPEDWRRAFPVLAGYGFDLFDYEAEDRFFASL